MQRTITEVFNPFSNNALLLHLKTSAICKKLHRNKFNDETWSTSKSGQVLVIGYMVT